MAEKLLAFLGRVPHDKALHFCGGGILAALGALESTTFSLLLVVAASFGKEIYDGTLGRKHGHQADVWDAVATLLGGVPVWVALWVRHA